MMSRSDGYQEPRRTVPKVKSRSVSTFKGYNADEDITDHEEYSYYDCEDNENDEE